MKLIFNKINILGIQKECIKKIPWILASHAFLIILFFILINLIMGVFLFYQYAILIETKQPDIVTGSVTFNYQTYQDILKQWQLKKQDLQETKDTIYLNPF